MKIGIIGAGIAGLAAGRELSRAGHEVTVIEKSRGFGGRLATRYAGKDNKTKLDHGVSSFEVHSSEFRNFASELLQKELIKIWTDNPWRFNGEKLQNDPMPDSETNYTAVDGMNSIGKYLARWVDVKMETKAGGLTYFGANRSRKRPWMINLTNYKTFEADAVVIATPAPQAYGIILTSQDEINTLKLIREIDEIDYDPTYSLMAGYGNAEAPNWDLVKCNDKIIQLISNEKSKKKDDGDFETALVIHSTAAFAREYMDKRPEEITRKILDRLADIAGKWASVPEWSETHFWRFSRSKKVLKKPYLELESLDAPLALIGDYFEGNTIDDSYCSGISLARHWIEKYRD